MFPVKEIPGLKSKVKGSWKWYLRMSSDCHTHIHTPNTHPNTHTSVCTHEHTYLHTPFDDAVRILPDPPSRFVSSLGRQRLSTGRLFTPYLSLTDCSYQQQHSRYPQDTCHVPNNTVIRLRAEPKGRFMLFSLHIQNSEIHGSVDTVSEWQRGTLNSETGGSRPCLTAVSWAGCQVLSWTSALLTCKNDVQMSYADQSQEQRNTREMCSLEWVKISDCTDFLKKRILCIFQMCGKVFPS